METRSVSGNVYPGAYDDGYLMYTDDSLNGGSAEEKVRAIDTYLSYGGRFSVDGELITHHVLFSLFPNWAGSDQVRRFVINPETNTLTISTVNPILFQGEETYSYLMWRRA